MNYDKASFILAFDQDSIDCEAATEAHEALCDAGALGHAHRFEGEEWCATIKDADGVEYAIYSPAALTSDAYVVCAPLEPPTPPGHAIVGQ